MNPAAAYVLVSLMLAVWLVWFWARWRASGERASRPRELTNAELVQMEKLFRMRQGVAALAAVDGPDSLWAAHRSACRRADPGTGSASSGRGLSQRAASPRDQFEAITPALAHRLLEVGIFAEVRMIGDDHLELALEAVD